MWNDLVTAALIGTERRMLSLDNAEAPFRELAESLSDAEPERALLAMAGATALYRRAGSTAGIDATQQPEACDPDDLPPCSSRAGLLLGQIMALSARAQHMSEWIDLAAKAGQRVSDEYLPRFLMQFQRRKDLPEHFYDVLGERGRWLAQQNEIWAYAAQQATNTERPLPPAEMPAEREAELLGLIDKARQSHSLSVFFALLGAPEAVEYPWNRPLTLAAISTLREILPGQSAADFNSLLPNLTLPRLAMQFSPACVPELQALANVENKNKHVWANAVKKAVETLEFRRELHREFSR